MNIAFLMPYETDVLKTLDDARHMNLGVFTLIGDKKIIIENCFRLNIDFRKFEIYDCPGELEVIDFCERHLQSQLFDYIAFCNISATYFNRIIGVKEKQNLGSVEIIDLPLLRHYLFLSNCSRSSTTDFEDKKKSIIQAGNVIKALNINKVNAAIISNQSNKTDILEMNIIKMILKDEKFDDINIIDTYTIGNLFSTIAPNNIYQTCINLLIMRNYEMTRVFIDSLRIFSEAKMASLLINGSGYAINLNDVRSRDDVMFSLLILDKIIKKREIKNTYNKLSIMQ